MNSFLATIKPLKPRKSGAFLMIKIIGTDDVNTQF